MRHNNNTVSAGNGWTDGGMGGAFEQMGWANDRVGGAHGQWGRGLRSSGRGS